MSSVRLAGDGSRSLLQLLRADGCVVEAPCGGNGRCGKCTVTVREGAQTRAVRACAYIPAGEIEVILPDVPRGRAEQTAAADPPQPLGLAVDLGTTAVEAALYRLTDGVCLGTARETNRQSPWGADVISRIAACAAQLPALRDAVRRQTADLAALLGAAPGQIGRVQIAGNTVMQHIFAGVDPTAIGRYPYTPPSLFDDEKPLTIPELPGAAVYLTPCVSGYIGGDITAGLYAAVPADEDRTVLFLDIGTNGEMALLHKGKFLCCSAACGPAFEGAQITCGTRRVPGAIDRVGRNFRFETADGAPPVGLCGSGLVDLLAELLRTGIADETGRLLPPDEVDSLYRARVREDENGNGEFSLAPGVILTAGDVRAVQLAKAAVAAGISILLQRAGVTERELDEIIVSGSFGSGLNAENAARIGLLPRGTVTPAGNTSLRGAARMLLSEEARRAVRLVRDRCGYTELAGDPAFNDAFAQAMFFDTDEGV